MSDIDKPDWFVRRDYSRLRQIGVWGWSQELKRLYELSVDHNLSLHKDDRKIAIFKPSGKAKIVLPGAPVAQLVGLQNHNVCIPTHLLPAIVVNIDAPDETVVAEFTRALAEARKQFPPPFSKPGPNAPNSVFNERVFLSWIDWHIVELAELLAWRATLEQGLKKNCPKRLLGGWLGFDKTKTNRAEIKLKDAIASLPAMAAQLKYDDDPARRAAYTQEALEAVDPKEMEKANEWAKKM